ncbi:MAG: class I SAM-dependent methyltransferase [Hyphomicrobium sp.]|uniref:class I SAM-dependent methyltransferase n=1 Tax=Hyphomicrobium sp. TaxID=82 RepID=UPI003D1018F2
MTIEQTQEYDEALVTLLEAVWGEGYLSPGGPDEIRTIVEGVALGGKSVLDIGCGTGGITRFLADTYRPAHIVGIDIDAGLIRRANERASAAGLAGILSYQTVTPGPLPFADGSFDVVFSKDAMVHIPDKEALFADIHRVLRPGGVVAASDWMSSTEAPFSPEMIYYLEREGLGFGIGSPPRYQAAMAKAGFRDIRFIDRNAWYQPRARREYETLKGPLYDGLAARLGRDFVEHEIEVWRSLAVVVDSGELRPGLFWAEKPAP